MLKFISRTFLLVSIAILLLGFVELTVRSWDNSYKMKHYWMTTNAHRVECLILGNSHTFFGLRPDVLGMNVFNLANVSQTIDYDLLLLQQYIGKCKNLKRVIINYDNSNAFDASVDETEPSRATFYRIYMDIPRHSLFSEYGFELQHASTLQAKFQKHIRGNDLEADSLGWGNGYQSGKRESNATSKEKALLRMEGHTFDNFNAAKNNRELLFRIADLCRANKIRLDIIQTPVSSNYFSLIPAKQQQFIETTLQSCVEKHGASTIDLRNNNHFKDSDFFDTDHLTDCGAEKLSKLLK